MAFEESLVFNAKVMPAYRVLDRAILLVIEYHRFDIAILSVDTSAPWDSRVAFVASWRVLFIS